MTRTPVKSSNIAAIAHDATAQRLEVQFAPNRLGESSVYEYYGVGEPTFEELAAASSIGRAFKFIRDAYPCRKIAEIGPDGIERPVEAVVS